MIVPSIDLQDGQAVQLIGGETKALDAGDPRPLARRFGLVGEIAVVDLDAALGQGSNAAVVADLIDLARCRVGGGIRDAASATSWLDRGAQKVVLGTAARPEVLRALPPERVVAALDARHGEVVVEGWRKRTGQGVLERIAELRELVGGFLVTFVEREGRLQGTDLAFAKEIRAAAGAAAVTIAGGITTPRRSPSSTAWAAMPRSAWRCTPAGSASPKRSPRPCGATVRMACGRRWWSTSAASRSVSAIRTSDRCAPPWSAARASTTRARAVCGSRAPPRARPRTCCGSMPTAIATACASRCASSRPASVI